MSTDRSSNGWIRWDLWPWRCASSPSGLGHPPGRPNDLVSWLCFGGCIKEQYVPKENCKKRGNTTTTQCCLLVWVHQRTVCALLGLIFRFWCPLKLSPTNKYNPTFHRKEGNLDRFSVGGPHEIAHGFVHETIRPSKRPLVLGGLGKCVPSNDSQIIKLHLGPFLRQKACVFVFQRALFFQWNPKAKPPMFWVLGPAFRHTHIYHSLLGAPTKSWVRDISILQMQQTSAMYKQQLEPPINQNDPKPEWPWVKIQIEPLNIPIPTKIGPKMGGEFTYQPKWDPKRF